MAKIITEVTHPFNAPIMGDELERQSGKLMALKEKGAFEGGIKAFKGQMKTISEEATLRSRQRLGVPLAESGMKTPELTTSDKATPEQTTTSNKSNRTSPRLKGLKESVAAVAPVERVLLLPRPPLPFRCSRRPARPSAASRSSCLTAFFADRAEGAP